MNFAEQLKAKKDLKVIEFANSFLESFKLKLVNSAEKGYSAYRFSVDTKNPSEKEKLQMYTDPLFVEHLNKNLDGVKVTYEKVYVESVLIKGIGWYKHDIVFKWGK